MIFRFLFLKIEDFSVFILSDRWMGFLLGKDFDFYFFFYGRRKGGVF